MKAMEQVVNMVEQMVKQVEGLKYTKNRDMAIKIVGGCEALINILEVSADRWNTRLQIAVQDVMKDEPKPIEMGSGNMPPAAPIASIPSVVGSGAPAQSLGLPPQIPPAN